MSSAPSTSSAGKRGGGSRKRGSSAGRETKRRPEGWECTLCTYDNHIDAFKCAMCDTRKGTSTRKPNYARWKVSHRYRLSTTVVEHQQTVHNFVLQQQAQLAAATRHRRDGSRGRTTSPSPSTSSQPDLASPLSCAESPQSPSNLPAAAPPPSLPSSTNSTPHPTPTPKPRGRPKGSKNGEGPPSHLKGVDRNSARTLAVTVKGITVIITDYKLKPRKPPTPRKDSHHPLQNGEAEGSESGEVASPVKEEDTNGAINMAPVTPPAILPTQDSKD